MHRVKNAEIIEIGQVTRYQKFQTIMLKMKYDNTENWFMFTEHDDKPPGMKQLHQIGSQFIVGSKLDFTFEIKTSKNKSNKLKIKSLYNRVS